jgi:hypothetical protein
VTDGDDIKVAAQLRAMLTALRLPRAEMGIAAMRRLLGRMRDPDLSPRDTRMLDLAPTFPTEPNPYPNRAHRLRSSPAIRMIMI